MRSSRGEFEATRSGIRAAYSPSSAVASAPNCSDMDGDGFNYSYTTNACVGITEDCNDNNASVLPPSSGAAYSSSVTLCDGAYNTTSAMSLAASSITVTCNGTNITGDGTSSAFTNSGNSNTTLRDCILQNFSNAISFSDDNWTKIINNTITGGTNAAILLSSNSTNALVQMNVLNGANNGILVSSYNATIDNNTILNTGYGIWRISSSEGLENATLSNNIVQDCQIGIGLQGGQANVSGNNVSDASVYGIYISTNSNNSIIYDNGNVTIKTVIPLDESRLHPVSR